MNLQLWEFGQTPISQVRRVPSDEARAARKSWDILRVFGEIFQYTQFAALFGRIVILEAAANCQRIGSGAAIQKFSCAP